MGSTSERLAGSGLLPAPTDPVVDVGGELAERAACTEPRTSATAIGDFVECPLKWWWGTITPQAPKDLSGPALRGLITHRVLEVFYNEPAATRTPRLLWRIVGMVRDDLEGRRPAPDGLVDPAWREAWPRLLHEGPAWQQDQLAHTFDVALGMDDIEPEPGQVKVVATEARAHRYAADVKVTARMDRLTESEAGGLVIDDYKTGKPPTAGTPVDLLSRRWVQPAVYAWVADAEGWGTPEAVRLIFPAAPAVWRVNTTGQAMADVAVLMEIVCEQMMRYWATGLVTARPSRSACRTCPLNRMCPAQKDGPDGLGEAWRETLHPAGHNGTGRTGKGRC